MGKEEFEKKSADKAKEAEEKLKEQTKKDVQDTLD